VEDVEAEGLARSEGAPAGEQAPDDRGPHDPPRAPTE